MDDISKARLAALVETDVNDLTDDDKAFIRARRSYLNGEQTVRLASVLEVAAAPVEETVADPAEAPKAKKSAK